MPAKGLNETRARLKKELENIGDTKAEKAVKMALIVGRGAALSMAPIDTSYLINSAYNKITKTGPLVTGEVGFMAEYAAAVHEASGVMKGKPRDPNDASRGNFWDPAGDAEPQFLKKGFEENRAIIDAVIKKEMKV